MIARNDDQTEVWNKIEMASENDTHESWIRMIEVLAGKIAF